MLERLQPGDTLVVTELSRLGRSIGQIVTLVDALLHKKVRLHCLKEGIKLDGSGQMDMQTEVMCSLFGLFSSFERRLIVAGRLFEAHGQAGLLAQEALAHADGPRADEDDLHAAVHQFGNLLGNGTQPRERFAKISSIRLTFI